MPTSNRDEIVRHRVAEFERQLRTDGLVGSHEHVFAAVTIVCSCHSQVVEACRFIEEHFNTDISLRSVSRMLHMDYSEFSRAFTEELHVDFTEYVARVRIRKIQERMLQPGTRILDIAERCGFTDRSRFSRTFRRVTGETARKYRQRMSKQTTPLSSVRLGLPPQPSVYT